MRVGNLSAEYQFLVLDPELCPIVKHSSKKFNKTMRYKATFADNTEYSLFGPEYFGDKPVFWRSHQSNLIGFSVEVCVKGRPKKVLDTINQVEIKFNINEEFDDWFIKNQSRDFDFGFSSMAKESDVIFEASRRAEEIVELFKSELMILKNYPFDAWRIDGGYKELEKKIKIGLSSMKLIESRNPNYSKSINFQKLKKIFRVPFESKIENFNILSISKQSHDKLEVSSLIELCNLNIKKITELNK